MNRNDILLKVNASYGTPVRDVDVAYIFGGAIRDSLADVPIKDVDIIGRAESLSQIANFLKFHGFEENNDYIKKTSNDIYSNGLIFEPDTYTKIVDNNLICV